MRRGIEEELRDPAEGYDRDGPVGRDRDGWDEVVDTVVEMLKDAGETAGASIRIMRKRLLAAQAEMLSGMLEVVEHQLERETRESRAEDSTRRRRTTRRPRRRSGAKGGTRAPASGPRSESRANAGARGNGVRRGEQVEKIKVSGGVPGRER
jgi:uncharacterized protein (DUF2235 family)